MGVCGRVGRVGACGPCGCVGACLCGCVGVGLFALFYAELQDFESAAPFRDFTIEDLRSMLGVCKSGRGVCMHILLFLLIYVYHLSLCSFTTSMRILRIGNLCSYPCQS